MERYVHGLVQERRNTSALAMELRLSCTKPSIYCPQEPTHMLNIHWQCFKCSNVPFLRRKGKINVLWQPMMTRCTGAYMWNQAPMSRLLKHFTYRDMSYYHGIVILGAFMWRVGQSQIHSLHFETPLRPRILKSFPIKTSINTLKFWQRDCYRFLYGSPAML